jgi:hypothetical protein
MIQVKTKIPYRGGKVTLVGHGFKRYQMLKLAGFARDERVKSVGAGLGSNDTRMRALSLRYARFKSKTGRGAERDLKFTGKMLQNFQVRTVSEKNARIENSTRLDRQKARANNQIDAWIPWSRQNVTKIVGEARKAFKDNVRDLRLRLRGSR